MASRTSKQAQESTGPTGDVVDAEVVERQPSQEDADAKALEQFRRTLERQPSLEGLLDWCVRRYELTAADQFAVMEAEVKRILAGGDAEAILAESKPISGKDFTDRPIRIDGFTLQPTDFSEGWPYYANINATVDRDGTTALINCGGPKVIAALKALEDAGAIPCFAMIKGDRTRAGFTVLSLVMPAGR